MEAGCLGLFMISACVFGVLLEHPSSAVHQAVDSPLLRRGLMGLAMGLTLIAIIHSTWGKRSGAHMNPAMTLTFLSLGKVARWDALFYIGSQFAGGVAGVFLAYLAIGPPLGHSAVNYVATVPGRGHAVAFAAETIISMVLMSAVLVTSNSSRFARWTPFVAGSLVATYITLEAPISGMSMNPARTVGSGFWADQWTALWVYFTAPALGMLLAAALYHLRCGAHRVFCAKLHHHNRERCIFRCNYGALNASE
jgi:aquaporin Z